MLSYLLLRLLPQWWPQSGCTLCTVHCTLTLTRRQPQVLMLFRLHKWFFVPTYTVCTSLATTSKVFLLYILLQNHQPFHFNFVLCVGSQQKQPQHSILNTSLVGSYFSVLFSTVFDPGLTSNRARIFVSSYFNHIRCSYFLCVTFQPTFLFFVFKPCHTLVNSSILLPDNGFQFLFFLGRVSI